MGKQLFFGGDVQLFDNNGDPLAGGKVTFYEPGTTTEKDVYTDSTLVTAHANPVILDANGRKAIWLNGDYKVKVEDSLDNLIYDEDNINPSVSTVTGNFNLIQNGSFEDNATGDNKTPDNWTLTEEMGSTVTLDTTDQQRGATSIKFTSAGSGGGNIVTTNFFEVAPGREISVSLFLKSTVVDVRNVVQIDWYDSAQATVSTSTIYDESAANPTDWTKKAFTVIPPATARFAKLKLTGCHPSDATSGSTSFDDVLVTSDAFAVARGYIDGLTLSNGSDADHDVDVAVGIARDSTDVYTLRLTSGLTKQIDAAWAAGNDVGGLFSGAVANNTWYHVFLILKDVDGTLDVGFDTSLTAANIPAGYTAYRRIGSVLTDGSANILAFQQYGSWFFWDAAVEDVDNVAQTTVAANNTLSVPPDVRVMARLGLHVTRTSTTSNALYVYDPSKTAQISDLSNGRAQVGIQHDTSGSQQNVSAADVITNTSSQVAVVSNSMSGNYNLTTFGWYDFRGQEGL